MSNVSQKAKALFDQACQQMSEGELDKAIETLSTCMDIAPYEAGLYRGRATAHFEMQNWKAAQSDFQRAMDLEPGDVENWVGLAMSLAMDKQMVAGIQVIEAYWRTYPRCVRTEMVVGLLYRRMGVSHKAKDYLLDALQRHPTPDEKTLIQSQLADLQKPLAASDEGPEFDVPGS